MKARIVGGLALVGLFGAIGFAEQSLDYAIVSVLLTVPYIIMKAKQPLEEEM